jgi:hypothetical protein
MTAHVGHFVSPEESVWIWRAKYGTSLTVVQREYFHNKEDALKGGQVELLVWVVGAKYISNRADYALT